MESVSCADDSMNVCEVHTRHATTAPRHLRARPPIEHSNKPWLQSTRARGRGAFDQANSEVSKVGRKEPVAAQENGNDLHLRFRLHLNAPLFELGEPRRDRDVSRAHAPPLGQPPLQFRMLGMMEGMLDAIGRRHGRFLAH